MSKLKTKLKTKVKTALPQKDPRGRKPYKPNKEDREAVVLLSGLHVHNTKIAQALRISLPTLHKYYEDELNGGPIELRRQLYESVKRLTRGTGAVAMRAAQFLLERQDLLFPDSVDGNMRTLPAPAADDKKKTMTIEGEVTEVDTAGLGKKEVADALAQVAHKQNSWGEVIN